MRVVWALAALALLSGCDTAAGHRDREAQDAGFTSQASAEAFAATGSGFDYRYAFRLPGNRLKGVLQSNADACDRLGPARCRILAMRYKVGDGNHIRAVLTIKIDPAIARAFGDAVTRNVTGSDGVLTDTEITGADSTASARSAAVVARLRDQLRTAQSAGTADAQARSARIQAALDTIAEVEASQGETLASTPVLITYESSNALHGLGSPEANFRTAGATLESSLGQLAQLLASIGPWLLLMLLVVLVLRWVIHGRPVGSDPAPIYGEAPAAPPPAPRERAADDRNLIQRWFSRDGE
jgi:hypothetical protein